MASANTAIKGGATLLGRIDGGVKTVAEKLHLEPAAFKNMLTTTGLAALWPLGSYYTDKLVDSQMQDYSPEAQYATKVAGSVLFAAPVLFRPFGDFNESLVGKASEYFAEGKAGRADFLMTALTLAIGGAGMFLKDTARKKPNVPTPTDSQKAKHVGIEKPLENKMQDEEKKDSAHDFETSAAMLAAIFAIAKGIEESISEKGEAVLDGLKGLLPAEEDMFEVIHKDNSRTMQPYDKIREGDRVIVPEGRYVPVDGSVIKYGEAEKGMAEFITHEAITGDAAGRKTAINIAETAGRGESIASQGLKTVKQTIIRAEKTVEESTISEMLESFREFKKGPTGGSISRTVSNVYIPLLLGCVALQFGYGYFKDRTKHVGRIEEKRDALRETIADPESDNQTIANQSAELWQYTDDHGRDHSMRQSLKRSAELAIKMAPCAIMASLLVLPFTKFRLAAEDINIKVKSDKALEELGQIDSIIADINGTLTTGQDKIKAFEFFDGAGKAVTETANGLIERLQTSIAKAEAGSEHRIGRIISEWLEGALGRQVLRDGSETAHEIATNGMRYVEAGVETFIGNIEYMNGKGIDLPAIAKDASQGNHIYSVLREGEELIGSARIELTDSQFRKGTIEATVHHLLQDGIKGFQPLTGTAEAPAKEIMKRFTDQVKTYMKEKQHSQAEIDTVLGKIKDVTSVQGSKGKAEALETILSKQGYTKPFYIGDSWNDTEALKVIADKNGITGVIDETGVATTKAQADFILNGLSDVQHLTHIGKDLKMATTAMVGAAGLWMTGLVGHHALAEANVLDPEKQPSTVWSSVLHEAPTALLALASALGAYGIGRKYAPKIAEVASAAARGA